MKKSVGQLLKEKVESKHRCLYIVRYISGPDDIFVKRFTTEARSSAHARAQCLQERDVYSVLEAQELRDRFYA